MSDSKHEDLVTPAIIGYSPKVVSLHTLALSGFLIPLFGIVSSVAVLFKARKANEELALANGKLEGHALYRRSIILAWLGIISFVINILFILALIWVIQNFDLIVSQATSLQVIQQFSESEVLQNVPANIDLESLGFTPEDIELLKSVLPEGTDVNNLSVSDILKLAAEYGIVQN